MALQTATNPETGEKVILVGNQWLPITQTATNDKGQKAYLANNQWITEPVAATKPDPTFAQRAGTALGRGLEAIPESGTGIAFGVQSALGMTPQASAKAEQIRKEGAADKRAPGITFEELEKTYSDKGLFEALKKTPAYVTEQILQSAPSMAVPLAAAAAATPFTSPIGGAIAGIGTYGVQQFGNFMRRQAEEGATGETAAPGRAAATAAVTAPLGYFADRFTLGLSKIPEKVLSKEVASELAKRTGANLGARVATGATLGIVAESPTEVLEQMAERWQAGLPLKGEDAMREYKEAFFGAAAVGGVGGAAARGLRKPEPEIVPEAKPYEPPVSLTGTTPEQMFRDQMAGREGLGAEITAAAREREAEAARQKAAEDEATAAAQAAAQERAAEMFAGQGPQAGADLIAAARDRVEEQETARLAEEAAQKIAAEKARDDAAQAILSAQLHPNPAMNVIQQNKALEAMGYVTDVDEDGNLVAVLKPRDIATARAEQEQKIVEGRKQEEMISTLGGATPNVDLMEAARQRQEDESIRLADEAAKAAKALVEAEKRAKVDYEVQAQTIGETDYSADPVINNARKAQALDAIGYDLVLDKNGVAVPQKRAEAPAKTEGKPAELTLKTEGTTTEKKVEPAAVEEEPPFIEATPVEAEAPPQPEEVTNLQKDLDKAEANRRRFTQGKAKGLSLWTALRGTLTPEEVNDIGPGLMFKSLQKKGGEGGTDISTLVSNGKLNDFLPASMWPSSNLYDEQESVERIKENVRRQDYYTEATKMAIRDADSKVEELERGIRELLTLEEVNLEIQKAVDEQAAIDREAQEAPAPSETRVTEERKGKDAGEAGLTRPTPAEIVARQDAAIRAERERKDAERAKEERAKADEARADFTLTGSEREADVAAARGQKDIFTTSAKVKPPELDTTGIKPSKGRNLQVQAAGKKFQEGTMSREEFTKYVDYYTPIQDVDIQKLQPPATDEQMEAALRGGGDGKLNTAIEEGTRVGLRMDLPARDAGANVVSIHKGKENFNPKTGEPYKSAGDVISYASVARIKDVFFAPRDQEKSLNMGINPAKEPLQTAEGTWVPITPEEAYAEVKRLGKDSSWTQVNFNPAQRGYFYDRVTGEPVSKASEMIQIGNFILAKDVEYAPKSEFLYSAEKSNLGFSNTKENLDVAKAIEGKSMIEVSKWAIDNAPNAVAKYFAQKVYDRIRQMQARGIRFGFEVLSDSTRPTRMRNARGVTSFIWGTKAGGEDTTINIILNGPTVVKNQAGYPPGVEYRTILHELLHVATRGQLHFLKSTDPIVKEIRDLYSKVFANFKDDVKSGNLNDFTRDSDKGVNNAFTDPDEMVSWGITDERMQKYMFGIKVGEGNAFSKLVNLVRKVLGIAPPYESALDRLISTTDRLLSVDTDEIASGMERVGYNFGPGKKRATTGEQQSLFSKKVQELFANKQGVGGIPLSKDERAYFESVFANRNDLAELHDLAPSAQLRNGSLLVDANDLSGLDDYVSETWGAAKKQYGGEGAASIPKSFSSAGNKFMKKAKGAISETFANQEGSSTAAGQDALNLMAKLGRTVKAPDAGYIAKARQSWDNVKDNPKLTADEASNAVTKFLDRVQTWAFSSDAALNNSIRRAVMDSTKAAKDKIGTLLSTSLSQTVHADAVASLFITMGNVVYDKALYKWRGVDDKANFVELSRDIDRVAEKYGLTKEQAELIAHTAFEAKRLKSMVEFNNDIDRQVEQMRAEAASIRKEKPVAASALSDKASKRLLDKKFIHMTDDEIAAGNSLFASMPELNAAVNTWNKIRENTVAKLVDSGLWDEAEAEFMLDNADYVPFFREDQLEEGKGPKEYIRGLMVQAKEQKLKGSSKPVNDIFDNMIRWTQYSINRAVRNQSALSLIDAALDPEVQMAKKVKDRSSGENVVRVWRNGKEEFYDMADPMFIEAFTGLEAIAIPSWKWATKLSNMLRQSVVLYPLFSVSQVPQDAFAAMFSSGLKPRFALTIPARAAKEFALTLFNRSKTQDELKQFGVVGVRDFTSSMVRMDAEIYAGFKAQTGFLNKLKNGLSHIAMASDNAVRQAVFEAAEAQGLSKAEALEKSFEIWNVRRRGTSKNLALAGQVIPFFNAYLAAQNVAFKTITGVSSSPTERKDALNTLMATTASVMTLSLIYAMMNGDDEDYENKPAIVRDRLLMIPGTGGLSIPLRADLFTLPKVITEHMYLLITDKGYEDGRKFRDSIKNVLGSAIFSPTPVPQAIKPLVEVGINYSFFTGRPLIGEFEKKKETARQFTDSTSELGKVLGSSGLISPIAADHMIRGMFGSAGGLIIYMTNPLLHSDPNVDRPTMSWREAAATLPGTSGFISREYESGLKNDFYVLRDEVSKVANTMADLKVRSPEKIEEYLSKEEILMRYGLSKSINKMTDQLGKIRKSISQITNLPSSEMSADEKMEAIKELRTIERDMLKGINIKELRAMAKI